MDIRTFFVTQDREKSTDSVEESVAQESTDSIVGAAAQEPTDSVTNYLCMLLSPPPPPPPPTLRTAVHANGSFINYIYIPSQ